MENISGKKLIDYEAPALYEYRFFGAVVAGEESSFPEQVNCAEPGEFD